MCTVFQCVCVYLCTLNSMLRWAKAQNFGNMGFQLGQERFIKAVEALKLSQSQLSLCTLMSPPDPYCWLSENPPAQTINYRWSNWLSKSTLDLLPNLNVAEE